MSTASPDKPTPTPEQRQAADPAQSAWVGASAGSGKTQVLTDRLMRLLLTDVEPASILCLTYTKAGASEMASRLFQRLSEWSTCSDRELNEAIKRLTGHTPDAREKRLARQLFARALETPGGLKVQTIHAFCERLLQLFPLEAGLVPGFRVLDDESSAALMREAILGSFEDPDEQVVMGWDFLSEGDLSNLEALEKTLNGLFKDYPRVKRALQEPHGAEEAVLLVQQAMALIPKPEAESLRQAICHIDEALYARWADAIAQSAEYKTSDEQARDLLAIQSAPVEKREPLLLAFFFTDKGKQRDAPVRKKLAQAVGITQEVADEQLRLGLLFDQLGRSLVFDATLAVYRAAQNVLHRIDQLKRQRGLYDFNDLIERTRLLLSSSEQAQWVLYKLDSGLTHVLVDEAQDTSPAQWQIVMALVAEFFAGIGRDQNTARTVFVVGDRKQSIFSFQGADVRAFDRAKLDIVEKAKSGGQTLKDVKLTISYRSLPNILGSVDAVFAKGQPARAGYGLGSDDEPDHTAHRKHGPGLVELWPLVEKPEAPDPDYWAAPVDRKPEDHPRRILARQIAGEIKSWIGRVCLPGRTEPVQPGDILILLQSRNLLFSALIAELRRLKVEVAGADRLTLNENMIVADLMMLIQWLCLPMDDHALACILKSPLVPQPVDEDELTTLAHGRGDETLWARVADSENRTRLLSYMALAREEGVYGFLSRVVQLCRADILARLGDEADDAMGEVLELALAYEVDHPPSLAGFVQWFQSTEHVIKREMDPKGGEVRIMTVHGSKGLEAPIVFLADAGDAKQRKNESRLVPVHDATEAEGLAVFKPHLQFTPQRLKDWDESAKTLDQQERLRLLYVGMTRAEDALFICGIAGAKTSWWTHVADVMQAPTLNVHDGVLCDGTPVQRVGETFRQNDEQKQVERANTSRLPPWAEMIDGLAPPNSAPRMLARDDEAFDQQAARQGTVVHRFLELAGGLADDARRLLAQRLGMNENEARVLSRLLDDPAMAAFFGPDSEAEVVVSTGGGRLRRIDRMIQKDGVISILDYKTGSRPQVLDRTNPYVRQMADYVHLLRGAYPAGKVRAALLWTQDGALDWLSDELLADA